MEENPTTLSNYHLPARVIRKPSPEPTVQGII